MGIEEFADMECIRCGEVFKVTRGIQNNASKVCTECGTISDHHIDVELKDVKAAVELDEHKDIPVSEDKQPTMKDMKDAAEKVAKDTTVKFIATEDKREEPKSVERNESKPTVHRSDGSVSSETKRERVIRSL